MSDFSRPGDGPGEMIWPPALRWIARKMSTSPTSGSTASLSSIRTAATSCVGARLGAVTASLTVPRGSPLTNRMFYSSLTAVTIVYRSSPRTREFLATWGNLGSAEGQLNSPWGITIDQQGDVHVADHKNHRVQEFTPDGAFIMQFGRGYGSGKGQLNRPSDVAVDSEGDVYVCDWAEPSRASLQPGWHGCYQSLR